MNLKDTRILSLWVNDVIDIVKEFECGKYKIEFISKNTTHTKDFRDIRKAINFIDNNIYIKETLGKSIRYVGEIEDISNTVEIYNYKKLQQQIDKASGRFFIG